MLEAILTFGGIVGAFAVFDALLYADARNKISEYLFGFHNVPQGRVEGTVARAFVSAFSHHDGRLSVTKILLWSFAMAPICAILGDLIFPPYVFPPDITGSTHAILVRNLSAEPTLFLSIFALVAMCSMPFDYWNGWVSSKIYSVDRGDTGVRHLVLDVVVSAIPAVFVCWTVANDSFYHWLLDTFLLAMLPEEDGFLRSFVIHAFVYLPASISSSLALAFFVRILMSLFVLTTRLALKLTTMNRSLVLYTRAHEFPFTTAGLFFGIVYAVTSIFD